MSLQCTTCAGTCVIKLPPGQLLSMELYNRYSVDASPCPRCLPTDYAKFEELCVQICVQVRGEIPDIIDVFSSTRARLAHHRETTGEDTAIKFEQVTINADNPPKLWRIGEVLSITIHNPRYPRKQSWWNKLLVWLGVTGKQNPVDYRA